MNLRSVHYIVKEVMIMARTKEQNERITMATKKKIMAAGLKLFARKGFALTNIKEIAQSAGISTGLIYRHFSSKDELFCELIEDTVKELTKAAQIFDSHASPTQAFAEMTSSLIKDIQSSEELSCYFLMITRSIFEEEALPQMAEIRKSDLLLFEKAAELIEKGQKMGEFKPGNPYKLALLYFSIIQGMANMRLFLGDKYIAPEIEDIMAFLVKEKAGDKQGDIG
jgi:AcrR family transcriptional regulator